jgi:hypothetical protein
MTTPKVVCKLLPNIYKNITCECNYICCLKTEFNPDKSIYPYSFENLVKIINNQEPFCIKKKDNNNNIK